MYNDAVLLMSGQQLTTMCVFVTTCQIVHGQFGLYNLIPHYFKVMDLYGLSTQNLLRDYHYETREQIQKNYPRDSYRIMDYKTAHTNGLLQHQSGKKKQGGNKRRGGGGGGGGRGGRGEGGGDDDVSSDSGQPEGGGNPGDREDGPPAVEPGTERKRRDFSAPDASFDATTVAAVVVGGGGGGGLHVQAYVRDDAGGVSVMGPPSLLYGADEDGLVQAARSYLPAVREMAEYVMPGITPGQVLVLAADAAFVTSEAVDSHRRRDGDQ